MPSQAVKKYQKEVEAQLRKLVLVKDSPQVKARQKLVTNPMPEAGPAP